MSTSLLDSHKHYCFHSPRCNVHQHPDLHHCDAEACPTAITPQMAEQAGLMAADGSVSCPSCGGSTTLKAGGKLAEVHVKLCTDETIHYPEMHKAGKIDAAQYADWKSTLTRDELLGRYKRVPDVHLVVRCTHEETALMDSDLPAFNELLLMRCKERAEIALLHQVPHQHSTTTATVDLALS